MKKSELKALIREVVEEVNNKGAVDKMAKALQANPKLAAAIAKRLKDKGAPINPSELNEGKSTFFKKLAMLAIAAGLSLGAVSNAKGQGFADKIVDTIEWGQTEIDRLEKLTRDTFPEYHQEQEAQEGTVRYIHNRFRGASTFVNYRKQYLDALRIDDPTEANKKTDEIAKLSTHHAWNLIKNAKDYSAYNLKGFVPSVVASITRQPIKQVAEIMEANPTIFKGVYVMDSVLGK